MTNVRVRGAEETLAPPGPFWGRGAKTPLNGGRLFIGKTGAPRGPPPRTQQREDRPHSPTLVNIPLKAPTR